VLLIGFGFYQARRAQACHGRRSRVGMALLWLSAAVVAATILFPQQIAALLAG
jgi:hypothetical protein